MRTALLGELVQVMTAEEDPAAAEPKDFFLLIFLQPAWWRHGCVFLILGFCLRQRTLVNNLIGSPSVHTKTGVSPGHLGTGFSSCPFLQYCSLKRWQCLISMAIYPKSGFHVKLCSVPDRRELS